MSQHIQSQGSSSSSASYDVNNEVEFVPTIVKHGEHEKLELLSEVYHRASGGAATQASYYSSNILKEFKTPTKNTVLHVAAFYGNDAMVDHVARTEPDLIASPNENQDTPLHVAARAGHFSIIKTLLDVYCLNNNGGEARLMDLMKMKNWQGNIMLHEAMMSSTAGTMIFDVLEESSSISFSHHCYELALDEVNGEGKSVLCMAVEARLMEAVNRILDKCPENATPKGLSPLLVAISNRDRDMVSTILGKKEEWIHLRDPYGGVALHFAAGLGYLEGVVFLLGRCKTCSIEKDQSGYLPIHLAAGRGHVEVVKELLLYCADLDEMRDDSFNNILHIAANSGKLDVVRYILQTPQLDMMINQKNRSGETPLHGATDWGHPNIVYALTSDHRVDLNVVSSSKETPLDTAIKRYHAGGRGKTPSLRRSLTWIALKSAGAKAPRMSEFGFNTVFGTERFKDRVDSLSVISTLIVTASVAACLAVPGEADGAANNLNKAMFHFFIFCITISLFTSISATIILIWGRFGVIELLTLSMEVAMPLLGTALVTLSLAFMAGIYTVISKLTWLATTFLVITAILVAVIFFLYMLLFLPSSSASRFSRFISYYPFIFLASLAEKEPVGPVYFTTIASQFIIPGTTANDDIYRVNFEKMQES
ncbi:protein ACCELERATED CELL DEATH 6-like [Arachis stenosperma]|uniref:protein ACCELERATED CELL DEATH 6-like n=1 Tax=Arachis stenosperma TaxID=217475 RepID=UPI0025AD5F50|nr:protein ACCELERATED CELL DEATH 6-like [Arachis stenosperma]